LFGFVLYLLVDFFLQIIIIIIDRQCVPMEYYYTPKCVFQRQIDDFGGTAVFYTAIASRVQNDYPPPHHRDTGRSQATAGAVI